MDSLPVEARSLPERPLLRAGYRLLSEPDRLVLEHAQRVVVLEGRAAGLLLPVLLPLLDGRRTTEEIASLLGPAALRAVEQAVALLAAHGVVCEGPPLEGWTRRGRETAEWLAAEADLPPSVVAERMEATVAVVGHSPVAAALERLLADADVRPLVPQRWRDAARAGLVVAAPGRGEGGALRSWNRRALRFGIPWLAVPPYDGLLAPVGPLVLPGETACYECYLLRRGAVVDYPDELLALERVAPAVRASAALDELVAAVASLHALRWLGTRAPGLPGTVHTVELRTGIEIRRHTVLRVPRCPACSGLDGAAAPLPWFELPVGARA